MTQFPSFYFSIRLEVTGNLQNEFVQMCQSLSWGYVGPLTQDSKTPGCMKQAE